MTDPGNQIRLVIADDDQLLLTALSRVLALQPGFAVVGGATGGEAIIDLVRRVQPDAALIDLDMPDVDGIRVVRTVRDLPTRTVIVTRHARPSHLQRALAAGADGFVLKSRSSDELVAVVHAVMAGQRWIDPEIAALALTMRECPLTARELEILGLLRHGLQSQEVADRLHLSSGTVRNYVSAAMAKLGETSGRGAAATAHAEGWI